VFNYVRSYNLWLCLALLALFIPAAASRDFHTRGEGREALIVQNMLSEGQYILAEGYAGDVPSKPPFLHWLAVISSGLLGQLNEFSTRLPSVLAAIATGLWFFNFLSRYRSIWISISTVLILSSSFEWLRAGATTRVDMLLAACVVVALTNLFSWVNNNYKGYPWLLSVAILFAILTKGPVGAVLPAFVFIVYSLSTKVTAKLIFLRGCLLFVPATILASGWYVAAWLERPDDFINKVYYENIARFLGQQEDDPHKASIFKLYLSVLVGFMPWTILLIMESFYFRFWRKLQFTSFRTMFSRLDNLEIFSLIVIACTLLFYSIPESKRPVYLLPMYPFLSLFVVQWFMKLGRDTRIRTFNRMLSSLGLICLILLPLSFTIPRLSLNRKLLELSNSFVHFYSEQQLLFWLWLVVSSFFATLIVWIVRRQSNQKDTQVLFKYSIVLFISIVLYFQIFLVPAFVNPISAKKFVQKLPTHIFQAKRLLSYGEEFYAISFYSHRRFYRGDREELLPEDLIFVSNKHMQEFLNQGYRAELIYESEGSVISFGKKIMIYKILG
jgi:4-amino-4-deoxy-L-arabinose transferase-like glycosyltransferase